MNDSGRVHSRSGVLIATLHQIPPHTGARKGNPLPSTRPRLRLGVFFGIHLLSGCAAEDPRVLVLLLSEGPEARVKNDRPPLKTHQNNRSYPLIHRPSAKASYNPQRFQNRQLLLRKCQCLFRQFCHVFLGSIQCLAILDDFLPLSLQQLPNKLRPFDGVFLALIL